MDPHHPRWTSLADAAEYVGVTERTCRRWIAAGRLPAYRIGPRLLKVDLNDVDKMFRQIPTAGGDAA